MFEVTVYPISLSAYTSQIYAGLFDLEAQGEISLHFSGSPRHRIEERNGAYDQLERDPPETDDESSRVVDRAEPIGDAPSREQKEVPAGHASAEESRRSGVPDELVGEQHHAAGQEHDARDEHGEARERGWRPHAGRLRLRGIGHRLCILPGARCEACGTRSPIPGM